ncbi:hypothetical protein BH24GEM1_BH24GEM1_13510 [soil metagenome]
MPDSPEELEPDDVSPSGETVAWDTDAEVVCPYCGEAVTIGLDPGGGPVQTYVEDCQVCCQPWQVYLQYGSDGAASVDLDTV